MDVDEYRDSYAAKLNQIRASRAEGALDLAVPAPTLDGALDRLEATTLPPGERREALRMLQAATFLGPGFDPYRARYRQLLRTIVATERDPLRGEALELLASEKDPVARDVIVKGLEDPAQAAVPPVKGMQLLALDDHDVAVPLARRILATTANVDLREESLRVLASDPAADEVFSKILRDSMQPPQLRAVSASALRVLDPGKFLGEAARIIADAGESPEIRAQCLGALESLQGQGAPQDVLLDALRTLAAPGGAPELRARAERMLKATTR